MNARNALSALGLLLTIGCALLPEDDPRADKDTRMFDAAYYKQNAAEYFQGRQYPRAREQFVKYLELEPDSWTGRLGLAFTDYYIARDFVVSRGDLAAARERTELAEKSFRELWDGTIEGSTETADPRRPQWKAALGVAMSVRQLGVLDGLEADRWEAEARKGGKSAEEALKRGVDAEARRDKRYREAVAIYEKLVAQEAASAQSISDLAELHVVLKQDAKAEALYLRWLDAAKRTREGLTSRKTEAASISDREAKTLSMKFLDEKLESNAEKQADVLSDLAGLAWARGEWQRGRAWIEQAVETAPRRTEFLLKLAQFEDKLMMYETGITHIDAYLKDRTARNLEFDDAAAEALRLRKRMQAEIDRRPKPRGG
ncbi:MAG: hypothetical protein RIS21_874 [Planctomycetota bacterium]|jgi:hypothetical protein